MASFVRHVQFSSALGVGYTAVLRTCDVEWSHGILAGVCCGVSGMLPDLDSDSGRPIRELFPLTAAVVPILMLPRLQYAGLSWDMIILFFFAVYAFIRYVVMEIFKKFTVHRGMFHSIPAGLIAAEIAFLSHNCPYEEGAYVLAGGVLLGFFSHLVLDEIYSVTWSGLRPTLKSSSGTALKLASKSMPATVGTWGALALISVVLMMDTGYLPSPTITMPKIVMESHDHDHGPKAVQQHVPPETPTTPVNWPTTPPNGLSLPGGKGTPAPQGPQIPAPPPPSLPNGWRP